MGSKEGEENYIREGMTGQAMVPDESQADVYVHEFWKWGTTAIFDMIYINLDTGSYLRQTYAKDLATKEKEKKNNCLHPYLERRHTFTPMVYSADGIPRTEAVVAQQRLALLLNNKLKR